MVDLQREALDRELFNRIASNYAKKDENPASKIVRDYQLHFAMDDKLQKVGPDFHLVEIACGIAATAKYLRGQYGNYTGIDQSSEFINLARQYNYDNKTATFVTANAKDCAHLVKEPADIVFASGALHHMTDLPQVFKSAQKLARPGGWFVALEPQRCNPIIQFARWTRKKLDPSYSEDQVYFSAKELQKMAQDNGLKEITVIEQGFLSPPFAQVILPLGPFGVVLSRFALAVDKVLDRFLPKWLRWASWNVVMSGRFPTH